MNRKVILSTTICESSLTIPGIKTVIGRAMKTGHSFLAWFNIYSKIAKNIYPEVIYHLLQSRVAV